ncbi:MAG: anthranilate synthase component I family protein [Phycisphaerae bacterium]
MGGDRSGILLESVAGPSEDARYSIFAIDPVRTLRVENPSEGDPISRLAALCRPWRGLTPRLRPDHDPPLVGGWIGYLGYETGRFVEPTAGWDDRRSPLPIAHWSLFDTVLIHDARADSWAVAGVDLPREWTPERRPSLADRFDLWETLVSRSVESPPTHERNDIGWERGTWNISRSDYLEMVDCAIGYIRAGDIFQVNLARRFRLRTHETPIAIYRRLCESNPAAYAAYLPSPSNDGQRCTNAVISSSPELFLRLEEGIVTSQPIKGTRPRGTTPDEDALAIAALANSNKDRAELTMIVDLVRNDLGRVCTYGTVQVSNEGAIEQHPTVFHRAATVRGRLRADCDAFDLLRAAFPGGSVTGAPKVRAMQLIHTFETEARGPYCGAIGYIGLDGNMALNLPIRTLTMADGWLDLKVGSGIVADSVPEEEYEELGAKAAGMLAAIGAGETRTVPALT